MAYKLRFHNGRLIKAETWKPSGEPCYVTKKGIGFVHFYNEDGTKWRIDFYEKGKIVSRKYQRKGIIHGPLITWYENRQSLPKKTTKMARFMEFRLSGE